MYSKNTSSLVPPESLEYVIDMESEELIPLSRPNHPLLKKGRRENKSVARATLERWRTRGFHRQGRHRVKLPTVLVGGQRFTSAEALRWFFARLNGTTSASTAVLHREHRRAEAELAACGL